MEKKLTELDDRVEQLREHRRRTAQAIVSDFDEKIDLSWIYHDNALEGVVLSYHELNSAINKRIISDVSLIPSYEEIKNQKAAIEWARQTAKQPLKKRKGSAWSGHVGFVVGYDGKSVYMLGFNQGDAVNVARFPLKSPGAEFTAFVIPPGWKPSQFSACPKTPPADLKAVAGAVSEA